MQSVNIKMLTVDAHSMDAVLIGVVSAGTHGRTGYRAGDVSTAFNDRAINSTILGQDDDSQRGFNRDGSNVHRWDP